MILMNFIGDTLSIEQDYKRPAARAALSAMGNDSG